MKMYINDLKQTENKAILKRNVKCYEHDLRYYAEEMIKNWK